MGAAIAPLMRWRVAISLPPVMQTGFRTVFVKSRESDRRRQTDADCWARFSMDLTTIDVSHAPQTAAWGPGHAARDGGQRIASMPQQIAKNGGDHFPTPVLWRDQCARKGACMSESVWHHKQSIRYDIAPWGSSAITTSFFLYRGVGIFASRFSPGASTVWPRSPEM